MQTPLFDQNTIFASLLLVQATSAACTLVAQLNRRMFRGSGFWLAGQALSLLALACTLGEPAGGPLITICKNLAYLASGHMFLQGIFQLRFRRFMPGWSHVIVVLAAIPFMVHPLLDLRLRIMLFCLFWGVQNGAVAWLTLQDSPEGQRLAHGIAALPFALLGLGNFLRLGIALTHPDLSVLDDAGSIQALLYFQSIAVAIMVFFGYFLLANLRTDRAIQTRQEALEQKNRELDQLNQTHQLMLSMVAHDLVPPLVSATRLARSRRDDPAMAGNPAQEYFYAMADFLGNARDLVDKVLAWARSSRKDFPLRPGMVSPDGLRDAVLFPLSARLEEKHIRLEWNADTMASQGFRSDPVLLYLLMGNLTGNAVKFTPPGGTVTVTILQEGPWLDCRIQDSGTGMSADMLHTILTGPGGVSTTGTHGERGSGLGIKLCQSILSQLGGNLHAESFPGRGSTFGFRIPELDPSEEGIYPNI